jgi:hypothetical protein
MLRFAAIGINFSPRLTLIGKTIFSKMIKALRDEELSTRDPAGARTQDPMLNRNKDM